MKRSLKIALAGGGTGGHFFPALHLARAISEKWETEFIFFGTARGIESRKAPEAGFELIQLPVSGLRRSLSADNLAFPLKLWKSIRLCKKTLRQFEPDAVIGTGGYVMGPALYAAQKLGIPTIIQEQNSYPGITTRLLSGKADLIFLAYDEARHFLKQGKARILITGNPVNLRQEMPKDEIFNFFNLEPNKKTVFVFGGSQGSKHINKAVKWLLENKRFDQAFQILWQTGKDDFDIYKKFVRESGLENVRVSPFIEKMAEAYAISDFAICRSGAMTLSELMAAGLPAILIPFPFAAADHQYKNALALEEKQAALVIRDDENLPDNLQTAINKLQKNETLLKRMAENIKKMHKPDTIPVMLKAIAELLDLENQVPPLEKQCH